MAMKPYVIKRGDYLKKLGHLYGFDPDAIWADASNAELKAQRGDPNVLKAGDVLHIPDAPPLRLQLRAGKENAYVATVPKVSVTVCLERDGAPLADERVVVKGLGDDEPTTSDGDGKVILNVPVHVRDVELFLPEHDLTYRVSVGALDPAHEASGARMRLKALGHYQPVQHAGRGQGRKADAGEAEQLAVALRSFQIDEGLEPTGLLDEPTQQALVARYGS